MLDRLSNAKIRDRAVTGLDARLLSRQGGYVGPTTGLAPGYVQGNLAIMPADVASEFLRFCHLNPKPCPVIGLGEPGDPHLPQLAADLDIRTDLPRYRIWKDGVCIEEPTDIRSWWRDDLVTFVIGCSFSFEEALLEDGIPLRHIACGDNVAMWRTSIECKPAGRFHGPMVVSMRPMKPADAIRAVQITSRFPAVHGAPIHIGMPELIGINDISKPHYGDPVEIMPDELPVFWGCGVTPQAAIVAAKLPFAITHSPGSMIVTDLRNSRLAAL
jgi:uncharacterized protein YcsI (UPF0317 family)